MITKIGDTSAQAIQQYQKNEPVKPQADKPVAGGAAVKGERVDLSSRAKEIRRIRAIVDQVPDVREARVQELRQQIENGTYEVKADKIAAALVGSALLDRIP